MRVARVRIDALDCAYIVARLGDNGVAFVGSTTSDTDVSLVISHADLPPECPDLGDADAVLPTVKPHFGMTRLLGFELVHLRSFEVVS